LELIWVKSDLIEEFLTNSLILAGVYPHFLAFGIIYGTISVLFNNTVFLKFWVENSSVIERFLVRYFLSISPVTLSLEGQPHKGIRLKIRFVYLII
jgi:hypothetical protein